MIKPQAIDYLMKVANKAKHPFTPEWLVSLLFERYGVANLVGREAGKMREYVREFVMYEGLSSRISGGVIYPVTTGIIADSSEGKYRMDDEELNLGFSSTWKSLVRLTYHNGAKSGNRIVLPDVHIRGLNLSIGDIHYNDVGYTSSHITKTWSNYFSDKAVHKFRDKLEYRVGYSNIFRCANAISEEDSPCLDSVSVGFINPNKPIIHANYSVSNVNRMTLMDFYLLHRFIRLILPIELLSKVQISVHFNMLTLDTTMLGWLAKIPEFDKIAKPTKLRKTGFKRIDLPNRFAKTKFQDVGLDMFKNNDLYLEELDGKHSNTAITYDHPGRVSTSK